jgi:hypothetical protein
MVIVYYIRVRRVFAARPRVLGNTKDAKARTGLSLFASEETSRRLAVQERL